MAVRQEHEAFTRFFEERGIRSDVRAARPYLEFRGPEDVESTRELFRPETLASNQLRDVDFMLGWLAGTWGGEKAYNDTPGGIVIVRQPPPGYEPMSPELKSWTAFWKPRVVHYHGPPTDEPISYEGKVLTDNQILGVDEAREHIDRKDTDGCWHGGTGEPGSGTNSLVAHAHYPEAKYRFLVGPKRSYRKPHTHERMLGYQVKGTPRKKNMLTNHLEKLHPDEHPPVDESHEHEYSRNAAGDAARIDVHPMALPLFESAEQVFFSIEGCPKADSILTAILDSGRRASVFSVPSVTLWNGGRRRHDRELERFASEYLRGKAVYIIADSDWAENDRVRAQAFYARRALRKLGVRAFVAAPPPGPAGEKQGVDDHLGGKHGPRGRLDELHVLDREVNEHAFLDWLAEQNEWPSRVRFRDAVRALEGLILFAKGAKPKPENEGKVWGSPQSLARVMGCSTKDVAAEDGKRLLADLIERGALVLLRGSLLTTKEKDLDDGRIVEGRFIRGDFIRGHAWAGKPPVLEIPASLRAHDPPPVRLGDFDPESRLTTPASDRLVAASVEARREANTFTRDAMRRLQVSRTVRDAVLARREKGGERRAWKRETDERILELHDRGLGASEAHAVLVSELGPLAPSRQTVWRRFKNASASHDERRDPPDAS